MCKWGTSSEVALCKPNDVSGRRVVKVDRCIAPIVQALNDAGIATVASCCGHGRANGSIVLADGRELIIHMKLNAKEAGDGS